MAQWSNFYMLVGTAAATLVGLMFIAITFGSKLVTPESVGVSRSIFSPIVYHFAHAFLLASAALVPGETAFILAVSAIVTALLRFATLPYLTKQLIRANARYAHIEISDWVLGIVIPIILYLALIVSGAGLLVGAPWSDFGLAFSCVAILVLGVYGAWDMLVWMASKVDNTD